jgi:hypothetical protein
MWTAVLKRILLPALVTAALPHAAFPAEIFWLSDPVKPGQSVQVNGMDLGNVEKIEVTRLKDRPGETTGPQAQVADIIAHSDTSITFVLPPSMSDGSFEAKLVDRDTRSITALVNAADVYWMQGDDGTEASPGGWIRVQGRNIARTAEAILRLKSADGKDTDIKADAANLWSARFAVPPQLAEGSYQAQLWNGNGDASTWKDAGRILVAKREAPAAAVMELLAIPSDGPTHDDTARLNAALEALGRRGGGTLLLRQGTYNLSGPLPIPDGVSLKGQSRDRVSLIWKDTDTPPPALISGVRNFSVENLTINATRTFDVIKGGFDPATNKPTGENITVRNVTMRVSAYLGHITQEEGLDRLKALYKQERNGAAGLRLAGQNILVQGCDILSSMRSFVIEDAISTHILENTFRNGRGGWYNISGGNGVIFENNRIIGSDLGASGGGITTLNGAASTKNVLFSNNSLEMMTAWDREAMTSDGPGGYYFGGAAAASANSIRLLSPPQGGRRNSDWTGAGVFVLAGRGMGAAAQVTGRKDDLVTIDHDLSQVLDATSIVTIVPMQANYLIIGNHFSDTGALQVYGTGYRHVLAENTMVRSAGISVSGRNYHHPQPNFYLQLIDNDIREADITGTTGIFITGQQFAGNTTVLSLGTVVRNNRLSANATIRINGTSQEAPGVRAVLAEGNTIDGTDIGIDVRKGVKELTLRNNAASNTRVAVKRPYP